MNEQLSLDFPLNEYIDNAASKRQVAGDHYKNFKIQPYVFCYENGLSNLQSEAISYISRYNLKWKDNKAKQVEDLQKAIHTLELLIEQIIPKHSTPT